MLDGMDSRLPPPFAAPVLPATVSSLPAWANGRARDSSEGDAAFAVGIALKSLDDLVRADLPWAGWGSVVISTLIHAKGILQVTGNT